MIFELYFNDLNAEAQAKLLDAAGLNDPSEANWDMFPIDIIEFYEEDDEDDYDDDDEEDEDL